MEAILFHKHLFISYYVSATENLLKHEFCPQNIHSLVQHQNSDIEMGIERTRQTRTMNMSDQLLQSGVLFLMSTTVFLILL